MGCGSSKSSAIVAPMPTAAAEESTPLNHSTEVTPERATVTYTKVKDAGSGSKSVGIIRVKEMPGSCDSLPIESQYGSSESVTESAKSVSEYRNSSAKSCDSGLGRDNMDIITENSSETMKDIARVPEDVSEPNLTIDGKQLKTPGPIGHRKRATVRLPPVHPNSQQKLSEQAIRNTKNEIDDLEAILQKRVQFANVLINELPSTESIIKRPVSRGGVAFDITGFREEATGKSRKPACVLKYAQQKRTAELVTHAELDEKQKAADLRRKEQEQMRLERIWAQQEKDKQVAEALAKFAAMQSVLKKTETAEARESKKEKTDEQGKTSESSSSDVGSSSTKTAAGSINEKKQQAVRPAPKVKKVGRPPVGKKSKASFKTGSLPQNKLVKAMS